MKISRIWRRGCALLRRRPRQCAPMRFMGAVVADLLVNLDVRDRWKRREREWAAATASKGAAWGAGDACIPPQVFPGLSVSPSPLSLFHIQLPLPTFSPLLSHPTTPHPIPPYPFPSRDSNSAPFPSGDWSDAAAGNRRKPLERFSAQRLAAVNEPYLFYLLFTVLTLPLHLHHDCTSLRPSLTDQPFDSPQPIAVSFLAAGLVQSLLSDSTTRRLPLHANVMLGKSSSAAHGSAPLSVSPAVGL